jgi:hypothetical protein
MSERTVNCPDCSLPMLVGCLPEVTHNGIAGWTTFLPGVPVEQRLLGLFKTGGIVVDWKSAIPVTVYRCPDCGLLKSYALKPVVATPAPTASAKESAGEFPPGIDDDRYRLGDA